MSSFSPPHFKRWLVYEDWSSPTSPPSSFNQLTHSQGQILGFLSLTTCFCLCLVLLWGAGGGGGMVHFSMGGGKEALKTGETEYYIIILTAPRAELSGYGGWREQRRPGVAHRGE